MDTLDHDPILHGTRAIADDRCSYSGPHDVDPCLAKATVHVCFLRDEDAGTGLRACPSHAVRAVENVVDREWWAHAIAPSCLDPDRDMIVDSYCAPPENKDS